MRIESEIRPELLVNSLSRVFGFVQARKTQKEAEDRIAMITIFMAV